MGSTRFEASTRLVQACVGTLTFVTRVTVYTGFEITEVVSHNSDKLPGDDQGCQSLDSFGPEDRRHERTGKKSSIVTLSLC